jgi:hypothetical protein
MPLRQGESIKRAANKSAAPALRWGVAPGPWPGDLRAGTRAEGRGSRTGGGVLSSRTISSVMEGGDWSDVIPRPFYGVIFAALMLRARIEIGRT